MPDPARVAPVVAAPVAPARPSVAYTRYVLAVLFLAAALNIVDRQILAMLIQPIKQELGVSDTAMGLLTGLTFALFYSVLGIPVARWADRGTRRTIIALGLFVWSGMTALSGLAGSFGQLALARIGVGVGEAAGSPPAHSLITDYFPPERRATALGIFSTGGAVGVILGLLVGGWVNQLWGWRAAFFAVGLPGLVLALVVQLTVREPVRGRFEGGVAGGGASLAETLAFLLRLPAYRYMVAGTALYAFAGWSGISWVPTFLVRVHHLSYASIGMLLSLYSGVTSGIGIFAGGWLADRLAVRDRRWYLWVPAIAACCAAPCQALFYLWPDTRVALGFLVPGAFCGAVYAGPTHAMAMSLARPRMRAMSSAFNMFVMNLVGLGLGPLVLGAMNDALAPRFGDEAIRYSLVLIAVPQLVAAMLYVVAARTLRDDLRAARAAEPTSPSPTSRRSA